MATKMRNGMPLDWSRLLGFDQVRKDVRLARSSSVKGGRPAGVRDSSTLRLSCLGAKIGGKVGEKPGF